MKKEYKLQTCPKCNNMHIKVVIGESGLWSCECGWRGKNPDYNEVGKKEYFNFIEEILDKEDAEDKENVQ